MCNPRRVRVQATRQLTQTWEQEVRRRVTATGMAVGEARTREPLGSNLGAPVIAALTAVLSRAAGWEWRDEAFRHSLAGGELSYHPDVRVLEIVAHATEQVSATGTATALARGEVDEAITAEGAGTYYDDRWGGTTEQTARDDAQRAAEAALDAVARQRIEQERAAADRAEGADVERLAAGRARQEVAQLTQRRGAELRAAAAARLTQVGVQGRNIFHLALAEAYRDAILAYARSRQAQGLTMSERDGVLDIEFEMEA